MKALKILSLLVALLVSINALARRDSFKNIYVESILLYKKGAYVQAIEKLNILQKGAKAKAFSRYWKGMCYSKIQEYDKAIINFKYAVKYQTEQKNVYYMLGQAHYASSNLEKALKAFKESKDIGFKKQESLYYIGFIYQTLENYSRAIVNYKELLGQKNIEDELKQSASYQYAEVIFAKLEVLSRKKYTIKQVKPKVKRFIIPKYQKAVDVNQDSLLAREIRGRIDKIRKKYGIMDRTFVNGKKYPKKLYKFYIKERFAYDSNVILESSDATSTALYKNSGIFTTTFYASGTAIHKRRFVFSPEIMLKNVFHTRQNAPDIHQNDSIVIEPALKMKLEHKRFGNPAAMLFNIEYNYTKRDLEKKHGFSTYGKTLALSVGDRFNYFDVGSTMVKFKHKAFASYSPTMDSKSNIISSMQVINFKNSDSLILYCQADFLSAEQANDSTNAYMFSIDWTKLSYYKGFDLGMGFSFTATDTKRQKATRGTEKVYNPSLTASKKFWRAVDLSISYDYSKKTSLNELIYSYSQHVLATELKYTF